MHRYRSPLSKSSGGGGLERLNGGIMRLSSLGSRAWTVPISYFSRSLLPYGALSNKCNDEMKHSITTAVRVLRSSSDSHSTGRSFFREQLATQSLRSWGGAVLPSVFHSMLRGLYSGHQRVYLVSSYQATGSPFCFDQEDSLRGDSFSLCLVGI